MDTKLINFFDKKSTYTDFSAFCRDHLAEFEALDRYENKWVIFGTLTFAKNPPSPSTQLKHFGALMTALADLNNSAPDQLHVFVRVEPSSSGVVGKLDAGRWHMHCLIGGTRILDGKHNPMKVQQACDFLNAQWRHGNAKFEPYERSRDGVAYVTKNRDGIGVTQFSKSLFKLLKKAPTSEARRGEIKEIARYKKEGRDPAETERIIRLRRTGVDARFPDEMEAAA